MKFESSLPKEAYSRIKILPEISTSFSDCWTGILGIYRAALFFCNPDSGTQTIVKAWIILVAVTLALAGFVWGKFLANGALVLGATPIPRALWLEWFNGVLLATSKLWALAVISAITLLVVRDVPWAWSAVAALFSIILCVSMIAALSNCGLWHWAWAWAIAIGVMLMFIFVTWSNFERWMSAAYGWYLPLVFLWPALLRYFVQHWREHPPIHIGKGDEKPFNPLRSVLAYFKRYTLLDTAKLSGGKDSNHKRSTRFYALIPMIIPSISATSFILQPWGSRAGLPHLIVLGLYALCAINVVLCKDLHWRYLLAPTGFRHGHIGTHLLTSSLTIAGSFILLLMLGGFAVSWSIFGVTPLRTVQIAAPYWIIFLEWIFALSVGIAMRSVRRVVIAGFVFALALLLAGLLASYILLFVFHANVLSTWFVIGPEYAAILILGIVAMITLSNRIWTTQRLLPYIISGSTKTNDVFDVGRWFPWPGRAN